MRALKFFTTVASLAALHLAACSPTPATTGTSGGTASSAGGTTGGGSTTGGGTTGGAATSGSTSTGGSGSTGGDAGLAGLNSPCDPTATADPCVSYFLQCSQAGAHKLPDGGSTCQLPGEQAACDPTIGCSDTTPQLHCVGGFTGGSSPNGCVYYCNTSSDCPTSISSCQPAPSGTQQICLFDFCGPGTSNGTQYYAPCASSGAADGTCEPLVRLSTTSDLGICDQGGSVPLWQACTFSRDPDGGVSTLCAQNTTCVPYASPNGPRPFCAPVCNPTGSLASGPSCAAGQTCFAFGSPDFGICLSDCAGGQACPSPTACQALQVSATQTIQECVPN